MKTYRIRVRSETAALLPPWFLSVTVDTSVLIGGSWWGHRRGTKKGLAVDRTAPLDLDHPELARWASRLAPALVRVGGTEADRIGYGFHKDGPPGPVDRSRHTFVLKGALWKRLNRWAAGCGLELLFTVSAGPGARDDRGRWRPEEAARLMRHTRRKGYPVAGWEFGNEVNAYPFFHGPSPVWSRRQYLKDFVQFSELVRRESPGTVTVGPGSAVWPVVGEPNPVIPALGSSKAAAGLDALSFHYYPQQSDRGAIAVRRAQPTSLLAARALDEPRRWIRRARRALSRGPAAGAPLWITETGHALYGGQRGLSDTWASSLWWLDQLGLMAQEGVAAVFRQSLVGGDYGLLDPVTFEPRPDYWATLLWKERMGDEALAAPEVTGPDRRLRVWAHRKQGATVLLLINLHRSRSVCADVGDQGWLRWTLAPVGGLLSRNVLLNGTRLDAGGFSSAAGPGLPGSGPLELAPLTCTFVELGDSDARLA